MTQQYTLTYNPSVINFRPNSVLEEIFQNINTILGTSKFSVPLFRSFGLIESFVDKPVTNLHPLFVAEIFEAAETYEPRVIVEEVKLDVNVDGQAYPTIIFSLRNGVVL